MDELIADYPTTEIRIRAVDVRLVRTLKKRALDAGLTLRDYILSVLLAEVAK